MRRWVASVLCLGWLAVPVGAQPSFDCSGALTPTERLICTFAPLGALDSEMAALFGRVTTALTPDQRERIVAEQRAWLERRNACGLDRGCLIGAYRERVAVLQGILRRIEAAEAPPEPPEPPAAAGVAVRVGPDGMIEKPRGDGAVDLFNPVTGFRGVRWPDGSMSQFQFLEVQPDTPPQLPADYPMWTGSVTASVDSLVRNLLRPDEAAILAEAAPSDFFQRLDYNLRVLAFITGQ